MDNHQEYFKATEYTVSHDRKRGRYMREEPVKPPRKKKNRMLPVAIVLVVLAVVLAVVLLRSCSKGDALEGQWRFDEITAYYFDGKGSGALILPEQRFEFRYKVQEDKLEIDFVSESARDFSYTFLIAGEYLTLTGGEGDEMVSYLLARETQE